MLETQYRQFIESDLRNRWIAADGISIYLRKAKRCITNESFKSKIYNTNDIANVSSDPKIYQKGTFYKFVNYIENSTPRKYDLIYIENVLTPEMKRFAERNFFHRDTSSDDISPCYYRFI